MTPSEQLRAIVFDGTTDAATEIIKHYPELLHEKQPEGNWVNVATKADSAEFVRFFASQGLSVNLPDYDGAPPVWRAVMRTSSELMRALLENGANPNHFLGDGSSPLHHAAGANKTDFIELLVKYGANLNTFMQGYTPLSFAACCGHRNSVIMLLNFGAAPYINKYDFGRSNAAEEAKRSGQWALSHEIGSMADAVKAQRAIKEAVTVESAASLQPIS